MGGTSSHQKRREQTFKNKDAFNSFTINGITITLTNF